jgi:D-aminopeptidase
MITNTHSVGVVRDAEIAWRIKRAPPDEEGYSWSLPVVAETADDDLNDMNGFHVKPNMFFTRWIRRMVGQWRKAAWAAARE